MLQATKNLFKVKDLRNKVLFILMAFIIYRIGSHIPVPGINSDALENLTQGAFGLLNSFSGGALQKFSIFALGVMPYITASIVIQLLASDVVPKLSEWNKQGDFGRKKIKKVTYYFAVVMAFVQGIGMSVGFNTMFAGTGQLIENPSLGKYLFVALILTLGSTFLIFLGETITKKGLGNGISLLIFAGIVSTFPQAAVQLFVQQYDPSQVVISIVKLVLIALALVLITAGAIYILEAYRRIPIQYAELGSTKGQTGNALGQNLPTASKGKFSRTAQSHLPIKLNTAGVIPVIFAVSLIMLPVTIATFWQDKQEWAVWVINHMTYDKPIGMVLYAILIFMFAYFYAFIQMDPKKMAENLQKSGGYVPGIRPGEKTELYLSGILKRLTFVGGIFLVVISLLPLVAASLATLPASVQIGGVSVLIIIGVALETVKQLDSQLMTRSYKGFGKK